MVNTQGAILSNLGLEKGRIYETTRADSQSYDISAEEIRKSGRYSSL